MKATIYDKHNATYADEDRGWEGCLREENFGI